MSGNEDYVSLGELGKRLGVDSPELEQWLAEGRIPALRIGQEWRIPAQGIEKFLEQELWRQTNARRGGGLDTPKDGGEPALPRLDSMTLGRTRRTRDVEVVLLGETLRTDNSIAALIQVLV